MATPPSLVAVAAGDPILYSDTADLQAAANRAFPISATNASTTSSTSWSDVPGLTFPCTNGKTYTVQLAGQYTVTAVGNGFVLGFNNPGGTSFSTGIFYGNGGPVTALTERVSGSTDGGTGITTVDGTSSRGWLFWVNYICTTSGTFAIRWKRPGATNSAITMVQGGGIVTVSA